MNDKEKIKKTMSILRSLGYTARMSLAPSTVDNFIKALEKTHKGAFLIGHDMDETYNLQNNLIRRIYLVWIGADPEEILAVCYDQGLNVYWSGRHGWAIELWPEDEEVPEMCF